MLKIEAMSIEEWIDTLPAETELKIIRSVDNDAYVTAIHCKQVGEVYIVNESNSPILRKPKKGGIDRFQKRLSQLVDNEKG